MGSERKVASSSRSAVFVRKVGDRLFIRGCGNLTCQLSSLDGEVMLWDLRAGDHAIKLWGLDNGLSAFDVHEQARVFVS